MNLILEAIKALFRKVENSLSILTKKIDTAQRTADTATKRATTAQTMANDAQTTADNAQSAADEAKRTADTVLYATINSNGYAVVTIDGGPVNGKIYTIIPRTNSTSEGSGLINVGGSTYQLMGGISDSSTTGYLSVNYLTSKMIFRANVPVPMLYSSANRTFYALSRLPSTYVDVGSKKVENDVPKYIYGNYSVNDGGLYKYMRVKSSTAGSTKLFDITVDDSGTLSAVEVV